VGVRCGEDPDLLPVTGERPAAVREGGLQCRKQPPAGSWPQLLRPAAKKAVLSMVIEGDRRQSDRAHRRRKLYGAVRVRSSTPSGIRSRRPRKREGVQALPGGQVPAVVIRCCDQ
jgi:hypothetical protein